MNKTSLLASATAVLTAGSLMLGAVAGAQEPPPPPVLHPILDTPIQVTTDEQVTVASPAAVPVQGDFDGNGSTDIFWYVAGTGADYLWSAIPRDDLSAATLSDRFDVFPISISGTYTPIVGDFDGNGYDDIFWYGPGSKPDSVWYFWGRALITSKNMPISGTYVPVVGNFDKDDAQNLTEQDDIFWYNPAGASNLWVGNTDKTFSGRSYVTQPPQGAKPIVGNWRQANTAEGAEVFEDILFYKAGTGTDGIWVSDGTGAFVNSPVTINGSYTPLVGEFDRNGTVPDMTDIFWYAPGTASDSVWMNTGETFQSTAVTVNGKTFKPFVVTPNLSSTGNDLIVWNNPSGADAVWNTSGSAGQFTYTSQGYGSFGGSDPGSRTALTGEYDYANVGAKISDVLWYTPGNAEGQSEMMWMEFGNTGHTGITLR